MTAKAHPPAGTDADAERVVARETFRLTATAGNFAAYFPTYLANGYFSLASSLHGTAPALSLMTGFMDRTAGDVSRPAALPCWGAVDYFDGAAWLNESAVTPETFHDYRQALDMFEGTLTTRYRWRGGANRTRLEVATFVSQAEPHLAATRLVLTPEFDGPVRLRFPLHAWPAPVQRLSLATGSWTEMKNTLAQSAATRPLPPGSARPAAPREILTWFDLQQALAAEGRELVVPSPTAPSRAAIWYAGEVVVNSADGDLDDRVLRLDGAAINGARFSVATAIELPENLNVRGRIERAAQGATLEIEANVQAGGSYAFVKYGAISREGWGLTVGPALAAEPALSLSKGPSHGAYGNRDGLSASGSPTNGPEDNIARATAARATGFAALLAAHQRAWRELWQSDIVVEGDPELQRVIHSDLFYLLQNSSAGTAWSMGACGLSPNYFGHVFWDGDTWNFPALLLLHPERAKSIAMFRHRTLGEAREIARRRGFRGAMFPWESDPESGAEQTPHFAGVNSQQEIYLNGAIAAAQWQYFLATGDRDWLRQQGYPIIRATADFWVSRVTHHAALDRYEIHHVTSVDEKYTDVNNETFTNAVAQKNLRDATTAALALGEKPDEQWVAIAQKIYLPFSEKKRRHLVFDESIAHDRTTWMSGSITFLTYPSLDLAMPDDVRRNDYAYALRENAAHSPELNQMMVVMLAIHAAEIGDAAGALRWLRHEQEKFLKPPFNVRSETPHNNCTYILATASGFLQNFLYGFTGLRVADEGLVAKYAPALPDDFKSITLRGVAFRGERFDLTVARDAAGRVHLTKQAAVPAPLHPPHL